MDRVASFDSLQRNPLTAPAISLSDSGIFHFAAHLPGARPNDFLPDWRPAGWETIGYLNQAGTARELRQDRTATSTVNDSSKEVIELRKSNLFENIHGEIGFLYGRSSGGRVNYDVESGYIFATAGDENVQISVGAFYEQSKAEFSKRGR